MNNIGENIHRQVIDTGLLPTLVKIVKKKVCSSLFLDVTTSLQILRVKLLILVCILLAWLAGIFRTLAISRICQ